MESKGSAAPECLLQAGKGLRLGAPHPCPTSQQTCREQTLLALERLHTRVTVNSVRTGLLFLIPALLFVPRPEGKHLT